MQHDAQHCNHNTASPKPHLSSLRLAFEAEVCAATYIGGLLRVAFGSLLRVDVLQGSHFTINGNAAPGSLGKGERGCEACGPDPSAPDSYAVWQNLTRAQVGLCWGQLLHHTLLPKT